MKVSELIADGWKQPTERPRDKQLVVYFFEVFNACYVGWYDAEYDSVAGRSGFTSWDPEVLCWYPLPGPDYRCGISEETDDESIYDSEA